MQYLIVDNDTDIICSTITDLVNRYDNPKEEAEKIVAEMNSNLIKSGDIASFRVEEVKDNVRYIVTPEENTIKTDSLEEATLVAIMINGEIIDLEENSKVIPLRRCKK